MTRVAITDLDAGANSVASVVLDLEGLTRPAPPVSNRRPVNLGATRPSCGAATSVSL